MRGGTALATGIAAALLAGCHPAPLGHGRGAGERLVTVAASLDCPDAVGDFSLGHRAENGSSCSYGGPDGAQLRLTRMVLTGGSPQAALARLDSEARAAVPSAPNEPSQATTTTVSDAGDGDRTITTVSTSGHSSVDAPPPVPPLPPTPPDGEHVRLDLPGLHIDADGDHARVSGFGQHVEADGDHAVVRGNVAGAHSTVVADDRGAVVRTGGAGSRSVDAALVLASEAPGPAGWRSAGYVARGPLGGPLVVAQVQARQGRSGGRDDPFDTARRLVNRNIRR